MSDGEKIEIPLGEMIETLRQELQSAQAQGQGQAIAFEIDKVELELQVLVSRKRSADGKIAFWVLSGGGGVENRGETTHTIKLSLLPHDAKTGERTMVRGEARQPLNRE